MPGRSVDTGNQTTGTAARTRAERIARPITEVFAPAVWCAAMPLVIAVHATDSLDAGLAWAALAIVFAAAVAWSRVVLRDHTTAQVLAGVALGVPLATATYALC